MAYGMYISAEGALAQQTRLETITNNIANADTAGFKRDLAIFQARNAEAIDQGLAQPHAGTVNDVGGGVMVKQNQTDFSQGPLKSTNIPTDFAIKGRGFFVVEKDGEKMLTRAGGFQPLPDGTLATNDGYPVLTEEGEPIVIAGPWQFSEDGTITSENGVARMAIAEPASLGDLVKTGENLFRPLGPVAALANEFRSVAQGMLEGSGTTAVKEMVEMIETTRAYEANVNMIKNHDSMFGTLISRVLKVG
ncbi:MAG: flagellar basal-body rod protein FlgF [Planctomycetia bacterium]|nr:flagellar basal-body rod protein FlgF [Planctomycetia bacterium]